MWIGVIIAIVLTVLFFSIGKNKSIPFHSKEKNDSSSAFDAGNHDDRNDEISDDGGSTDDGGDSGEGGSAD
jgi:hypothetical protein